MRKKIINILIKFLTIIILLKTDFAYSRDVVINIQTIGKDHLQLSKNLEIKIEYFDEVIHKTHREWKTRPVLKEREKTIFKKYPVENEASSNSLFYFVPISNGKYIVDLNGDGQKEFAVVYDHGGNAPATSVTVFSLDNKKLKIFKKAWYSMEGGNSVIWNERDRPKKCLYTGQGICENL